MRSKRPSDHSDSAGLGMHQGEPRSLGRGSTTTSKSTQDSPNALPATHKGQFKGDLGASWLMPAGLERTQASLNTLIATHRQPRGTLRGHTEASWVLLGGPGRSWGASWAPGGDLEVKRDDSGRSPEGLRRVQKTPESVFFRSQGVKYTYFHGFEHAHIVNCASS